jgi:hypothetical protein
VFDDLEFEDAPKLPPRRSKPAPTPAPTLGRLPPHSVEAEEYLLSCCFIDGSRSLDRCVESKLPESAFFVAANRVVYSKMLELYRIAPSSHVAIEVVAEELKKGGQLEAIGGVHFLMAVSSRISTSIQFDYFLAKVRELHTLRELIKISTQAVEQCYEMQGDVDELIERVSFDIGAVKRAASGDTCWQAKAFVDFKAPPANDPNILLGKYRYLCRGGTAIIVGPSHVGKSSACFQWAVNAALGRDMLGIETHGGLTSLIINGEDDEGDVGECSESMIYGLDITPEEIEIVRKRVNIVESRSETGLEFFAELKKAVAKHKPDIVWINPLLAFAGVDITKPGEASKLRAMLNSANPNKSFAYMIVHHTNKPPGQKEKEGKNWNEHMYNMTGSADIVNLARVVIGIEAKEPGHFIWRLSKRGKRAGVTVTHKADPEQGRATYTVEIVTEVHAKHADRMVTIADGRKIPLILWEADDEATEKATDKKPIVSANKGGRKASHCFDDFRATFREICHGRDNVKPYNVLHRACQQVKSVGGSAFNKILSEAVEGGLLNQEPNGYYMPGLPPPK